jgi:hypothetical protein
MLRDELEKILAALIDAESAIGIRWWPGEDMAGIAVRRWQSFARRHNTKSPTEEDLVQDLATGLQAHFEPDIPYTPRSEWLHLARKLAGQLRGNVDCAN